MYLYSPFCTFSLQVFLEGVKGALTADSLCQDGWYEKVPYKGLRAAARVYAGWGFSQSFYWNEVSNCHDADILTYQPLVKISTYKLQDLHQFLAHSTSDSKCLWRSHQLLIK